MKISIDTPTTSPELDYIYKSYICEDVELACNKDYLKEPRIQKLVKKMNDLILQEEMEDIPDLHKLNILFMLDTVDLKEDINFLQRLEHDVSELQKQETNNEHYRWWTDAEGIKIVKILHLAVKDRIQAVLSTETI